MHFPSWHMSPWRQTLPQVPQLLLSNRVPMHGGEGGGEGGLGPALSLLRRLRLLPLRASVGGTSRTIRPETSAPAATRTARREPPRETISLSASSQCFP